MPILVLSGRTEDSEKIAALEHGADDYITKPFAMQELAFRVRAALDQKTVRRSRIKTLNIQTGALDIHLDTQTVTLNGQRVSLDEEEYALLRLLALHGGQVLTAGHIANALWGRGQASERRRDLQQYIAVLRRKLEAEPSFPRYIVTEPAVGYRLEMLPPGI